MNAYRQDTYLNASISVDDDGIYALPMSYTWNCADESGGACLAPSRDKLDIASLATDAILSIPGGILPIGESETVTGSLRYGFVSFF